ncbi:hypothetical protein DVH24_017848, partial [Malus domestica]
ENPTTTPFHDLFGSLGLYRTFDVSVAKFRKPPKSNYAANWHQKYGGDAAIETLRTRGWCFGDLEQVEEKILIYPALSDDTRTVVNSVEAELTNMNLKSISARSMPDPHTLLRSSHLLQVNHTSLCFSLIFSLVAEKIDKEKEKCGLSFVFCYQMAWVRDVAKSSTEDFSRNLSPVEYSHTPAIPDDVVPGTKVCLEGKVTVRNGIVCLSPKVVTVLGGVVQSLNEEWQMNTKYSEFSRSSLRISQESDGNGPSPFEKLQVGAAKSRFPERDKFSRQCNHWQITLMLTPRVVRLLPELLRLDQLEDSGTFN